MKTSTKGSILVVLHVALLSALVGAVIFLAVFALQANSALCEFRGDLQRRHDAGIAFLIKHPYGIPGISAADIQRSLESQRAALDSLEGLWCPK